MSVADLVRMANDIGQFFAPEPQRENAVAGVADHLRRFWDPRMRRQIIAHVRSGGEGLAEIVREAVQKLEQP